MSQQGARGRIFGYIPNVDQTFRDTLIYQMVAHGNDACIIAKNVDGLAPTFRHVTFRGNGCHCFEGIGHCPCASIIGGRVMAVLMQDHRLSSLIVGPLLYQYEFVPAAIVGDQRDMNARVMRGRCRTV